MAEHVLERRQIIERPREEVFEFFADAGNLERITPPELNFKITSAQPIDIKRGAFIDYRLNLRGIPITWKTEITQWNRRTILLIQRSKALINNGFICILLKRAKTAKRLWRIWCAIVCRLSRSAIWRIGM